MELENYYLYIVGFCNKDLNELFLTTNVLQINKCQYYANAQKCG